MLSLPQTTLVPMGNPRPIQSVPTALFPKHAAQGILPFKNVTSQSSLIWHVIQQTAVTVWSRLGNDVGVTTGIVAAIIISRLTFVGSIEKFGRKSRRRRWDVIDVVEMLQFEWSRLFMSLLEPHAESCSNGRRSWYVGVWRNESSCLSPTFTFCRRNNRRGRSNGNLLSIVRDLRSGQVGSKGHILLRQFTWYTAIYLVHRSMAFLSIGASTSTLRILAKIWSIPVLVRFQMTMGALSGHVPWKCLPCHGGLIIQCSQLRSRLTVRTSKRRFHGIFGSKPGTETPPPVSNQEKRNRLKHETEIKR